MKKSSSIVIILLLIININQFGISNVFSSNHFNEQDDYSIQYKISGRALIIGEGQANIDGTIKIDSTFMINNELRHYMVYEATVPLTTFSGSASLVEGSENKFISSFNTGDNILGAIWDLYSNYSTLDMYSMLRLTENELETRAYNLLNETVYQISNSSIYSPDLRFRISAYQIDINHLGTKLFYDTNHLRLVGLSFINEIKTKDGSVTLDVYLTVMKASFVLPKVSGINRIQTGALILLAIVFGLIILSPVILTRRNKGIKIKGGLDKK